MRTVGKHTQIIGVGGGSFAEQLIVAVALMVEVEIRVEARVDDRAQGIAPFAYEHRVGVIGVHHLADIAPDLGGRDLIVVVLDQ